MRRISQLSFDTALQLCLHLPYYHRWLPTIELLTMMRTIFMGPGIRWILVLLTVSYLWSKHYFPVVQSGKLVFVQAKIYK